MKTTIKNTNLGKYQVQLEFDELSPQVVVGGKVYDKLDDLAKEVSEFSEERYVDEIAEIINFIFSGLSFEVIQGVEKFCIHYQQLLKEDENFKNYGEFDTRVIKGPHMEKDRIVFFVEERATGLPFKVDGPFPYADKGELFSYRILPYISLKSPLKDAQF